MDPNNPCLFCDKGRQHIIAENDFAFARYDEFPVSKGHAQIIPKEHRISFFDLKSEEAAQLFELLKDAKEIIEKEYNPDGFNIGIYANLPETLATFFKFSSFLSHAIIR